MLLGKPVAPVDVATLDRVPAVRCPAVQCRASAAAGLGRMPVTAPQAARPRHIAVGRHPVAVAPPRAAIGVAAEARRLVARRAAAPAAPRHGGPGHSVDR
jgi:hypothetical protein